MTDNSSQGFSPAHVRVFTGEDDGETNDVLSFLTYTIELKGLLPSLSPMLNHIYQVHFQQVFLLICFLGTMFLCHLVFLCHRCENHPIIRHLLTRKKYISLVKQIHVEFDNCCFQTLENADRLDH